VEGRRVVCSQNWSDEREKVHRMTTNKSTTIVIGIFFSRFRRKSTTKGGGVFRKLANPKGDGGAGPYLYSIVAKAVYMGWTGAADYRRKKSTGRGSRQITKLRRFSKSGGWYGVGDNGLACEGLFAYR